MKTMDLKIADAIEARAWRDLFAAAPSELGCESLEVPGTSALLLRAATLPVPLLNRVVGLDGASDLTGEAAAWIGQAFREVSMDKFWVPTWQHPDYDEIPSRLAAWRPEPDTAWYKFLLNLESELPLPREGKLHVRLARLDEAQLAGDIVCRGMGMPPSLAVWFAQMVGRPQWQVYVACNADDEPVAIGFLYVDGLRAWLGVGTCLPEARNQGAQQMLLSMRLLAARAAGCVVAAVEAEATESGEFSQSARNIDRAGFRQIGIRTNFLCASN